MAGYIDLVYLDKSLQILRASSGTLYVHVRLPADGEAARSSSKLSSSLQSNGCLPDLIDYSVDTSHSSMMDDDEDFSESESEDENESYNCSSERECADSFAAVLDGDDFSVGTLESTASMAYTVSQKIPVLFIGNMVNSWITGDDRTSVAAVHLDDEDDDDASVATIASTASMALNFIKSPVQVFGSFFESRGVVNGDEDEANDDDESAAAVYLDDITVATLGSTATMDRFTNFGKMLPSLMNKLRAQGELEDASESTAQSSREGEHVLNESSSAGAVRLGDASEYTLQSTASMALPRSRLLNESSSAGAVRLGNDASEHTIQTTSMAFHENNTTNKLYDDDQSDSENTAHFADGCSDVSDLGVSVASSRRVVAA